MFGAGGTDAVLVWHFHVYRRRRQHFCGSASSSFPVGVVMHFHPTFWVWHSHHRVNVNTWKYPGDHTSEHISICVLS